MKITQNTKNAAAKLLAAKGNLSVVVTKTRKWNTNAYVRMCDLEYILAAENGTVIDSGSIGTFRKMEATEILYSTLMQYAK